jgi:hypothetical protein
MKNGEAGSRWEHGECLQSQEGDGMHSMVLVQVEGGCGSPILMTAVSSEQRKEDHPLNVRLGG